MPRGLEAVEAGCPFPAERTPFCTFREKPAFRAGVARAPTYYYVAKKWLNSELSNFTPVHGCRRRRR